MKEYNNFILKTVALFCVLLFFTINSFCQTKSREITLGLPDLIPYRKGDLWGYCDKDKNIKIECKYAYAELFDSFGFARVYSSFPETGSQFRVGLIDENGVEVLPISETELRYEKEEFNYTVIPDHGIISPKFGIYDYIKYNGMLIILGMYPWDNLYKNIYIQRELETAFSYPFVCFDKNGFRILKDSFSYYGHYENPSGDVKYIIGVNKWTRQQSLFSMKGKKMNGLEFDQIFSVDSLTFLAVKKNKTNGIYYSGIYSIDGKTIIEGTYGVMGKLRDRVHFKYRPYEPNSSDYKYYKHKSFYQSHFFPNRDSVLYKDFTIVSKRINKKKYKLLKNHDMTPLVLGNYSSIQVDERFEFIYLYNMDSIKCVNFKGEDIFEVTGVDSIYAITHSGFVVIKDGKKGLWSSVKKDYLVNLHNYINIYSTLTSNYILQESSSKYFICDSLGNFSNRDSYDIVEYIDLGLSNDSLFYFDNSATKTFVSNMVHGYSIYGDAIFFTNLEEKHGYSNFDYYMAYNLRTHEYTMDSLMNFSKRVEITFNNIKYLKVEKLNYWDWPGTGRVNMHFGLLNKKGEYVIPCIYDNVTVWADYLIAQKGLKTEVYDIDIYGSRKLISSFMVPEKVFVLEEYADKGFIELYGGTYANFNCLGLMDFNGTKYYE